MAIFSPGEDLIGGEHGGSGTVLTGESGGTSGAVGALSLLLLLDGSISGQASVSGAVDRGRDMSGMADGTSSTNWSFEVSRPLEGTASGSSTVLVTLDLLVDLQAAAAGTSTVSGDLATDWSGSGSSSGTSTTTGDLAVVRDLDGSAGGVSTVSAFFDMVSGLSGVVDGSSSVMGFLDVARLLTGSAEGISTVVGSLGSTTGHDLHGDAEGTSTVSGYLDTGRDLSGSASGISTVSGSLASLAAHDLSGFAGGGSTAAADLQVISTQMLRATNFRDDFDWVDVGAEVGTLNGAGGHGWTSLSSWAHLITSEIVNRSGGFARESFPTDLQLQYSNQVGGEVALRSAEPQDDWYVAGFGLQGIGPDNGGWGQAVLLLAFNPGGDEGVSVVVNGLGGFFDVYRHRTYLGTGTITQPTVYDNPTSDVHYRLAYQPSTGTVEIYMNQVLGGTFVTDANLTGQMGFGLQADGGAPGGDELLVQYFIGTSPGVVFPPPPPTPPPAKALSRTRARFW